MSDRPNSCNDASGDPQSPIPRMPNLQPYGQLHPTPQQQFHSPPPQHLYQHHQYVPQQFDRQYYNMPPPQQPYFMSLLDGSNPKDMVGSSTFIGSENSAMHTSNSNKRSSSQNRDDDIDVSSPIKKNNKKATTRNHWTEQHDDCLIPYLAEEVKKGCKPDKQFKLTTFNRAAEHVNNKCGTCYTGDAVKNHVKILRSHYQLMVQAKDLSGAGWDETTKTVTMSQDTYLTWSSDKRNSKLLIYVNTPLTHLEELKLIVGDDAARGEFRSSIFGTNLSSLHIDIESQDPQDDVPIEVSQKESQSKQNPTATTRSSKGKSKKKSIDLEGSEIAKSMDNVAIAIVELDWTQKIMNRVHEFDSIFDSKMLELVLDFFLDNEKEGKRFNGRSRESKEDWLRKFGREHGYEDEN